MSISEAVALDKNWTIQGFSDYGPYTTDKLLDVQANHALCFVFKPFIGSWMQVRQLTIFKLFLLLLQSK